MSTATDVVVEARGLVKRFGRDTSVAPAVDGVDLTIRRGEVVGFLGPNGAGKTTTLRMVLGLVRPTAGSVRVLGRPPGDPDVLARTGSMIEGPAFYPYLSGRANLQTMARLAGAPSAGIDDALAAVDLTGRAHDRFSAYSLGMKQRLGVAAALLKDPELVVLDEPTNGLDPAGMRDMRALVVELGRQGRTVVLSSHLMAEVQEVCERVVVISQGHIVAENTVAELRGGTDLLVRVGDLTQAGEVVARLGLALNGTTSTGELRVAAEPDRAPELVRALVAADIDVWQVRTDDRPLEDAFFELTGTGVTS